MVFLLPLRMPASKCMMLTATVGVGFVMASVSVVHLVAPSIFVPSALGSCWGHFSEPLPPVHTSHTSHPNHTSRGSLQEDHLLPRCAVPRPRPYYPTRSRGASPCEGVSSHRGATADGIGFQGLTLEEAVVYRSLTDHDRDRVLDGSRHPDHACIDRAPDSSSVPRRALGSPVQVPVDALPGRLADAQRRVVCGGEAVDGDGVREVRVGHCQVLQSSRCCPIQGRRGAFNAPPPVSSY